ARRVLRVQPDALPRRPAFLACLSSLRPLRPWRPSALLSVRLCRPFRLSPLCLSLRLSRSYVYHFTVGLEEPNAASVLECPDADAVGFLGCRIEERHV